MFDIYQKTIKNDIEIKGIGIHSGQLTKINLIPADKNTGIVFIKNGIKIPANIKFAKSFDFSTTLENNGEKVQTVEHLLASLYLLGIDNLYIEIEGIEVPILDGSSKIFVEKINKTGIENLPEEKVYAVLEKDILYSENDKYIYAQPSDSPVFTYEAKYNNFIGETNFSYLPNEMNINDIAGARTYCFFEEVEKLREIGLAKGGSLENAVVFKDEKVLNPEGLRYPDEPVRHKLLDLLGDLYLLGNPIIGNIKSTKGGHALNAKFLRYMMENNAFSLVPASKLNGLIKVN